jgi:glyoxylase-like metal-dependent hydrolase (beta-lactamase superfamily II)
LTLIDAGFPRREAAVFRAICGLGRSPDRLKHLFTHGHPDHIGSAATIVRETGSGGRSSTCSAACERGPQEVRSSCRNQAANRGEMNSSTSVGIMSLRMQHHALLYLGGVSS